MGLGVKVLAALALYATIFLVAWYHKRKPDPVEKKTFWVLWPSGRPRSSS